MYTLFYSTQLFYDCSSIEPFPLAILLLYANTSGCSKEKIARVSSDWISSPFSQAPLLLTMMIGFSFFCVSKIASNKRTANIQADASRKRREC